MIIKAPRKFNRGSSKGPVIFLAGSIEMGKAINWQDDMSYRLVKKNPHTVVLNPRRDDWDSSWEQSYDNLQFNQQVTWEQIGIQLADIVIFVFDENTKSPITLLEFGQCIGMKKKMFVYCKKEFWRYGNIEMMCHLNGIPLYTNEFNSFVDSLTWAL